MSLSLSLSLSCQVFTPPFSSSDLIPAGIKYCILSPDDVVSEEKEEEASQRVWTVGSRTRGSPYSLRTVRCRITSSPPLYCSPPPPLLLSPPPSLSFSSFLSDLIILFPRSLVLVCFSCCLPPFFSVSALVQPVLYPPKSWIPSSEFFLLCVPPALCQVLLCFSFFLHCIRAGRWYGASAHTGGMGRTTE